MSGAVFTGTPWWDWTYNATGEVESAKHSATTGYNRAYDQDGLGNCGKYSGRVNILLTTAGVVAMIR